MVCRRHKWKLHRHRRQRRSRVQSAPADRHRLTAASFSSLKGCNNSRLRGYACAWHVLSGHERTIILGPRAQEILRPLMQRRAVEAYLFSPREAAAQRKSASATKDAHRRPNQKPRAKKTSRTIGDPYDSGSDRRAVQRACDLADVPHWRWSTRATSRRRIAGGQLLLRSGQRDAADSLSSVESADKSTL